MNDLLPELLLTCTLRGSALILVAIAVAPFARRVFGRNGAVWLWTAAVLALLWPIMPATPFSVQNAWNTTPPAETSVVVASPATVRIEEPAPLTEFSAQAVASVPVAAPSSFAKPKPAVQISMSGWVLIIWAAGTVLFLILLCVRWLQTTRLVQRARIVSDRRWDYLRHRIGIKRRVRLAVTSEIRAPVP